MIVFLLENTISFSITLLPILKLLLSVSHDNINGTFYFLRIRILREK